MIDKTNRYKFIVFSQGDCFFTDIKSYKVNARILKQNYSFCYFFEEKPPLNSDKLHLDTFSSIGRRLKPDGIFELYNSSSDGKLRQQLFELIESRDIISQTKKKLNITTNVEFAKIFSVRATDVNIWLQMITKPESFKLEVMRYIINKKDISNDSFIEYLISKASHYYKVSTTNLSSSKEVKAYCKDFEKELEAKDYFYKLKKSSDLEGLNLEIKLTNHFSEVLKRHLTNN